MLILHYGRPSVCSPCDARNAYPSLPLQGIHKRGVNLPPRFAITISRQFPQDSFPYTVIYLCLSYTTDALVMYSPCDARNAYRSRHTKVGGKFTPQICHNHKPAISSTHSFPYTVTNLFPVLILHYGRTSVCTVRVMSEMLTPLSDPRRTKAICLRACQRVHPGCSNVPFPVGDVTFTFFSAKYVHSNLSPKTCRHYILCRLCK